jgi:Cu-Zn family superoxide dismutase
MSKTWFALFSVGALLSAGCQDNRAKSEERTPRVDIPANQTPAPQRPPEGSRIPADSLPHPADTPAPAAEGEAPAGEAGRAGAQTLEVKLNAASGSSVQGTVKLTEVEDGVRVVADLTGAPAGKHGFHVHEKGDCSDPQARSAGDHFAPDGHQHGLPTGDQRHLGDMGNLTVEKDGSSRFEIVLKGANLKPNDPRSLLNRAIILHEKEDKGTQPSGDAGGRIACGVIAR